MPRIRGVLFVVGAAAFVLVQPPVATQVPGITTIQCEGATSTIVAGNNDAGRAVGFFTDSTGTHGIITDGRHGCEPLPGLPAGYMPLKLNDSEHIVGIFIGDDGNQHGFIYRAGRIDELWYPDETTCQTFPTGINNRGQVVGFYSLGSEPENCAPDHPFMWEDGIYTALNEPSFANDSVSAMAINPRGDIAGSWLDDPAEIDYGYVWLRGESDPVSFGFPVVGNLPVPVAKTNMPLALSPRGEIVGFFYEDTDPDDPWLEGVLFGPCRGFFRDRDGTMTELKVPGATYTCALGLNAAGEISGIYTDGEGPPYGILAWRGFIAKKELLLVSPQ